MTEAQSSWFGSTRMLSAQRIGVIGAELIMSRTGLGYEIGYAYNNFDNAVMYPLIVFVLAVAGSVNAMFFMWEKKLLARRRR